jgi:hypothetical protein
MIDVILTAAVCYLAAGIYVLLVFDYADSQKGWAIADLRGQVHLVLTWPSFIYFIANEDQYMVEIPIDDE